MDVINIPTKFVHIDENQPRKTFDSDALKLLQDSISEKGIEVPIFVRKTAPNCFYIVDGERRYRSAAAIGLETLPCIIQENAPEMSVLEKQLRTDCLKEKFPSLERDAAIYKYWEMVNSLPDDAKDKLRPENSRAGGDWTIHYVARQIGVSPYVVRIATNKEDFKKRNSDFHKKIRERIESHENPELIEKRYNTALEETARMKRDSIDDEKRKEVIEEFIDKVNKSKAKTSSKLADSQVLRRSLKEELQSTGLEYLPDRTDDIESDTFQTGNIEGEGGIEHAIFLGYMKKINSATHKMLELMVTNKIKQINEEYMSLLRKGFLDIVTHLGNQKYKMEPDVDE